MTKKRQDTAEFKRLDLSVKREKDFKNIGPYVSDRAWGTVREDYSESGDAWNFFPHEHARSRTYRWNEDGIGGICNRFQNFCLSLALWNGKDPIIKERLFGLTGEEGNHGEDVKEYYFYIDSTPTHSYMKMLYKYPQAEFPYKKLVDVNRSLGRDQPEFELFDCLKNEFLSNKYFDVFIEYAKADDEDILCKITAHNRNKEEDCELHLLPHLWFRNFWSWGYDNRIKPSLRYVVRNDGISQVVLENHKHVAGYNWYIDGENDLLFTENETNSQVCFGTPNDHPYKKDSINDYVVSGKEHVVNPEKIGTKAACHFKKNVPAGGSVEIRWRFCKEQLDKPFENFEQTIKLRISEADEYFDSVAGDAPDDQKELQRQAFAGVMWSKMFYHYGVQLWLEGDPIGPPPPKSRKEKGNRNVDWKHLYNVDVISMPDKWEYPWYACWDTAFHTITIAQIDPEWAKRQLILMTREWYMHPNGQLPAYEWVFGDVNPPVHAWASWRVYQIANDIFGEKDVDFLESIFQKLLLNFTWWVNRKDTSGQNIFEGGFLGLDNIGVFDRSNKLPDGGRLEQADGTAWMGMYCLNMLRIALELATHRKVYEDMANKFFEHFLLIANAINGSLEHHINGLWDSEDKFYYDFLHLPCGYSSHLKVQSFVGLIPLFAVETIEKSTIDQLPKFKARMKWLIQYRPNLVEKVASLVIEGDKHRVLLSLVDKDKLMAVVTRMSDPEQFLSDYGLRSLSKAHAKVPYVWTSHDNEFKVGYEPAESCSNMFGGNSNWRGPIWFPVNYLMIESLLKFHNFYGNSFQIEYPSGTGQMKNLHQIAQDISKRLLNCFLKINGKRAFWGPEESYFNTDPNWNEYVLFYEYFHGCNGTGLGASHQTGWTSLVAQLVNIINFNDKTLSYCD